jgi:hypothetical protein
MKWRKLRSFSSLIESENHFSKKSKSTSKNKNNNASCSSQVYATPDKPTSKISNNSKCPLMTKSTKTSSPLSIGSVSRMKTRFLDQQARQYCWNSKRCLLKENKIRSSVSREKSPLAHASSSIPKTKNLPTLKSSCQ